MTFNFQVCVKDTIQKNDKITNLKDKNFFKCILKVLK